MLTGTPRRWLPFVLVGLLLGVALSGTAAARLITVDDDGGADFTTIQAAVDSVESSHWPPGQYTPTGDDTIYVEEGIYKESIDCYFMYTYLAKFILRGAGKENTIIEGTIEVTGMLDEIGGFTIRGSILGASGCEIYDNLIVEGGIGISSGKVHGNIFSGGGIDIGYIGHERTLSIFNNAFDNARIHITGGIPSNAINDLLIIAGNTFRANWPRELGYASLMLVNYPIDGKIDATENWFGTAVESEVLQKIPPPPDDILKYFIIRPWLLEEAGPVSEDQLTGGIHRNNFLGAGYALWAVFVVSIQPTPWGKIKAQFK